MRNIERVEKCESNGTCGKSTERTPKAL